MSDIIEISAVHEYHQTGDVEVLARHIENGGTISAESRQVIADALRGSKPRKRSNVQRNARIVELMRFYMRGGFDGQQHNVEESRAVIAEAFNLSEDRIKQIWENKG